MMNQMRHKAMAMMVKEMGGLAGVKKKLPTGMDGMKNPQDMAGEQEPANGQQDTSNELEQMMVSPEEKQMILSMRAKSGAKQPADDMSAGY